MFFMMGITDGRKDFDFNQGRHSMKWQVWQVSGVYDIHGAVTVLHSVF